MLGETQETRDGTGAGGPQSAPWTVGEGALTHRDPGRVVEHVWAADRVVRLLVDAGRVLGDLHDRDLTHGRVADAAAWWVEPSGRRLLADVTGVPGAPEQDVRDLARAALTLLGRLPGECAQAPATATRHGAGPAVRPPGDDPPHAEDDAALLVPGVPHCPSDDVPRERLRHVLLLAASGRTPGVPLSLLLGQALAVADPAPLPSPDAAVLARDALLRGAGAPTAARRARHRDRGPARGVLAPLLGGTAVLVVGLVALVGLAGRTAPPAEGFGADADDGAVRAVTAVPAPYRHSGAAERLAGEVLVLTRARADALAGGDLLRLLSVTAPGSPAALADLGQFAALHPADRGRTAADGSVAVRVEDLRVLSIDGQEARVLLVAAVGHAADGGAARPVVLSLAGEPGAWRVTDVAAPDGGG